MLKACGVLTQGWLLLFWLQLSLAHLHLSFAAAVYKPVTPTCVVQTRDTDLHSPSYGESA